MQFGFALPLDEEAARAARVRVKAYALELKVGLSNAIRTDGLTDPVTADALAFIRQRYSDTVAEVSAKQVLSEAVSQDELATVGLIKTGIAYFKAVDAAMVLIIAEGTPVDPLASDPRWPTYPLSRDRKKN